MSTPYFSIKRVASSELSFLVTSGVAAFFAFATVGVAAFSLIGYSPPTPVVLFAIGLGGLSLLGWRRKRRASPDLSEHPRNVGHSSLSTRLETLGHIRDQIVAIPTPNNSSSGNCRGVGGGGIHFFGQTSEGAWPRSLHCLDDHKKETQARALKRENNSFYFGKSRHASVGSCGDPTIRGPGPRY